MLKLPLGEYDIANYAYDIERKICNLLAANKTNMQQHLVA